MKCVYRNLYAKRRLDEGKTLLEVTFAAGILAMALSLLFGSLISLTVVARLGADAALAAAWVELESGGDGIIGMEGWDPSGAERAS